MKKLLTITIAIMLAIPQPPALAGRLRLYGAVGSESRPGGQGYALRPMAARFSGIERVQKIDRATSDRLRGILDSIEQGDEISENDEAFVKSCCLHYGFKQKEFFKPRLVKKHVKGFIDMLLLLIDIDLAPKKEYKCTTEFSSSFSVLSEDAFLHLTRNFAAAFANCVALTRHINFYGTVNIDELVGRMHRLARRMGTASQATSFFDLRDNPAILFAVVDLIVSYSTQSVPLIKEFLDAQVQHSDSDGMHILSVEESIRRVSSVDNFLRNIQLSILAPDILISCNLNELIIDTARFIFGEEEMRRSAVILDVDNTMPELRLSPSVWLVLSNLFTNARDAVEEKAAQPEAEGFYQEIKITSKYDGVNNAAVFSVVDNGV